jgi:hypothetical protein
VNRALDKLGGGEWLDILGVEHRQGRLDRGLGASGMNFRRRLHLGEQNSRIHPPVHLAILGPDGASERGDR